MGEAKRRGTYEQRKAAAIEKRNRKSAQAFDKNKSGLKVIGHSPRRLSSFLLSAACAMAVRIDEH